MADGRFDDLLLNLARQHKSVEDINYSILSFFERRTDLFHVMERSDDRIGFGPGAAEAMFFKHFHHFQQRYRARAQPHLLRPPGDGPPCESPPAAGDAAAGSGAGPAADEAAPQQERQLAAAAAPEAAPQEAPQQPAPEASAEGALPEQTRKMMKHISTWNGAATDKYYWSQSLREVTVEIEVGECTAKDIQVDITATRLCVKCKGGTVLEGKLHEKVVTEETMWHLDSNRQLVMSLEKHRDMWWKCVLEGDPEIDTTKVESTRKMEEYDGETQGAIRKIMFDQNQKLQGKPTSDQIRTADIMKDAWNAPGSPFRGTDFDPSLLNLSSPVGDEFFQEVEDRRLQDARRAKDEGAAAAAADP